MGVVRVRMEHLEDQFISTRLLAAGYLTWLRPLLVQRLRMG
jgi:hypothetical protein